MILFLRLTLILLGIALVGVGFGFLTNPVTMGPDFGLEAVGNQGLSSLRADFTAYFWVAGGALLFGAWRRRGDVLLIAVALLGITFIVRAISLFVDGPYDGWYGPMAVEALTVIVALVASRVLPRSTLRSSTF